jgi:hypothetical protein
MVNNFMEMHKIWKSFPPGESVEERLRVWYSCENQKNILEGEPQDVLPYSKHVLKFLRKGKAWRPPSDLRKMATSFKYQGVTDYCLPSLSEKESSYCKS